MFNSVLNPNFHVFSNLKVQNKYPETKISNVSFLGTDKFDSSLIKKETFSSNLSDSQKDKIRKSVNFALSPSSVVKPIGFGADGAVYKIDGVEGYPNGLAMKVSHIEAKNPKTGEMQRVGCNFSDEISVLEQIKTLDDNSQHYVAGMNLRDGRNVLLTTFVRGKNPDIELRPLNSKNLASAMDAVFALDCDCVLHRDLKKENIIIDENDNAGLIDFGAAISFNLLNFDENVNQNNFPSFIAPYNLKSMEDTLIFPYLDALQKIDPKGAKNFFENYLKLKSSYHSKRVLLLKNAASNQEDSSSAAQKLNKMADYEQTLADAFLNPDKNVIHCELLKGGITYNSELAYKNEVLILNPLANISLKWNSLIQAKKLEKFSSDMLMRPNTPEKRKYYAYMKEYAKFYQERISSWVTGLSNWLIDCLKTDSNNTPDYMKDIISQCTDKENLQDFEIPNIGKFG